MNKRMSVLVVAAMLLSARASMPEAEQGTAPRPPLPGAAACLHDKVEREADRIRRELALALAKEINQAQGTAAERRRSYVALSNLRGLPPTPKGFELRLYTDGAGYVVSIKDTLDPCRYGVFSDQGGLVYDKSPLDAPVIAEAH